MKITYEDKESKLIDESVPNKNKVRAEDMNEIKSSVNTLYDNQGDLSSLQVTTKSSLVGAVNELKSGEVYSSSEVKTNEVWIDGKPLYRRVFSFQTSNNMNFYYEHGITNLDKYWINLNASYVIGNNESLPVNWYYSPEDWARAWIKDGMLRFRCPSLLGTNRTLYLTIEYTKRTD